MLGALLCLQAGLFSQQRLLFSFAPVLPLRPLERAIGSPHSPGVLSRVGILQCMPPEELLDGEYLDPGVLLTQ